MREVTELLKVLLNSLVIPVLIWVVMIERRISNIEATMKIVKDIVMKGVRK